jgi:uncharacterized protein YjdB
MKMKKISLKNKKTCRFLMLLCLILSVGLLYVPSNATSVDAASKIKISKKTVTLQQGKTVTLKITGTKKTVKLSSSNKKVATVTQKGKVTAKKAGKATITAKVAKKKYTCTVTVKKSKSSKTGVSSISLNSTSKTLYIGDTAQLKATISPSNAANPTVTWSSSDDTVATVSDGLVTAKAAGTATITAKAGSCSTQCTITVKKIEVSSVSLNVTSKTVYVGESFNLSAAVSPFNATDSSVTWSSSNDAVATVSDGYVTTKTVGTTTITATVGSHSAQCTITVKKIEVSSVSLNVTSKTVYVGDSFTLSATVSPDNATDPTVTWSSSNENVATVSDGVVTANASGFATITAKAGSRSAQCLVWVKI